MDTTWMNESVASVPRNNWLYRLSCFFLLRKRLRYSDLFLILLRLNEKRLGYEESRKRSFQEILRIYKYNNNKLPNGIE